MRCVLCTLIAWLLAHQEWDPGAPIFASLARCRERCQSAQAHSDRTANS